MDQKTVKKIADLARIEISPEKAQELAAQLSKAINYFEQISKVDTTHVEPLITPAEIESFWRDDVVEQKFSAEEMVQNAPESQGHLFKVPPVV